MHFRTLVGAGLKNKADLRRPLPSLVPSHIGLHPENVASFSPEKNTVTTSSGSTLTYDTLVVAAGLKINYGAVENLSQALGDANSGVSSIYSYDTCDKAWHDIDALRGGRAIFTQPAGVIKCAGAPQKIMWMAWDRYRRTGRKIDVEFMTGMPTMFSVPKWVLPLLWDGILVNAVCFRYSEALNQLRISRGVGGTFGHNLTSIDVAGRTASFKNTDGQVVTKKYDLLHVVPPQGPLDFIKNSPLADSVGWVDVNEATLQHKKFSNVFSL